MPEHALRLLATLLALDPLARGTAAGELGVEYFVAAPRACEPACLLPRHATLNKEMDAKSNFREDLRRRGNSRGGHGGVAGDEALSRGHKSMQDTNQSHVYAKEALPVVVSDGTAVGADDDKRDGEEKEMS